MYFLLEGKLRSHGIKLGRDGFINYLRTQNLLVKPRKSYTKTTFSYLSLVTDAYSRCIVGHHLSRDVKTENVIKAMDMAIAKRTKTLIHHSDRGTQYCSDQYQSLLRQHGIQPSTTDCYDYYQNALAEPNNGILKQDFLLCKCKNLLI